MPKIRLCFDLTEQQFFTYELPFAFDITDPQERNGLPIALEYGIDLGIDSDRIARRLRKVVQLVELGIIVKPEIVAVSDDLYRLALLCEDMARVQARISDAMTKP